ncbi:HD domain-containing phosphohydrolase [Chloroflexota bacterium]
MQKHKSRKYDLKELFLIFERANEIASMTSRDDLLDQMMELILEVAEAESGTLYMHDRETEELVFHSIKGRGSKELIGTRIKQDVGIVGSAFMQGSYIRVDDLEKDERWKQMDDVKIKLKKTIALPLLVGGEAIGVVQIFNHDVTEIELLLLLANRMASEVDKAALLDIAQQHSQRLENLLDIFCGLGATLDREQLLHNIVSQGRRLLDIEACSIFLIDSKTGDVHLYTSSEDSESKKVDIFVPKDKGIVGEVIRTGNSMIVDDVLTSPWHYAAADEMTGFVTRSILAAPLNAAPINLGRRGSTEERTLGVIEALNKMKRPFNNDDLEMLESLAIQAATVLYIAELYSDANELFFDLIEALSSAIDAKDPYTEFHSTGVAKYSVAIAEELEVSPEMLNHIHIGGMLHDLGKIGVPDNILKKSGKLDDEEYEIIKEHPTIGKNILEKVEQLEVEIFALAQHHEHFDGSGYPEGLAGDEISLIGRIVTVADVLDALTTDRPYRDALDIEVAIDYISENSGTMFDPQCVDALIRSYQKGNIQVGAFEKQE